MKSYAEGSEAKNFEILKINILFILIFTVKIFSVFPNVTLCHSKIPCVFPVWKK